MVPPINPYVLPKSFQSFLRPLVRSLAGSGVGPYQSTIAAFMLGVVVGGLIALNPTVRWPMLLMPGALFIRMALNAIDGMLAREHGMKSPLGAILNEIGDVLSDAALYLPLAAVPGLNPLWVVLVVVLAIISEMTGVIAVQIGSTRRYDGPMGKSDRALVFGVLCLLLGFGVDGSRWADGLMLVTMALLVVTIINRAARALAEVD